MRKQTSSLDGFIPRQASPSVSEQSQSMQGAESSRPKVGRFSRPISERPQIHASSSSISRSEVDESLAAIHDDEQPKQRRTLFRHRPKRPLTRKQKIVRRLIIFFVLVLLGVGAYVGIRAFIASGQVFQGSVFDLFQTKPLKMDSNGRSNIVVFGTSEDDPGHEAAYLTDSIMVISVDQNKKNAYMISIPRDLVVDYGMACFAGYQGKINALYGCYSDSGKKSKEKQGANALKKKVGEVLGLDIQYYAHVNYTVVRDVVKALGNEIEITIKSTDPRGIMDANFDWKCKGGQAYASQATILKNCPPNGHFIDFPNGKVKLDAEHALYLAQARGANGITYGLERSNFDREVNQQKIVKAIREKAVSAGTLADVGKVTGLIDALGKNLRTDFATAEVRTLMQIGQDIPSDKIKSVSLVEEGNELLGSGLGGVVPSAGSFEYGQIQAYIDKNLSSNPVIREASPVAVLNGTSTAGVALTESGKLTEAGYTVISTGNAPATDYTKTTIWRLNKDDNDGTAKALAKRYGVKVKTGKPAFAVAGAEFVVIIGTDQSNTSGR